MEKKENTFKFSKTEQKSLTALTAQMAQEDPSVQFSVNIYLHYIRSIIPLDYSFLGTWQQYVN